MADRGFNIIIVANDVEKMNQIQAEVGSKVAVKTFMFDFAKSY